MTTKTPKTPSERIPWKPGDPQLSDYVREERDAGLARFSREPIPQTRDAAIAALVEQDVARWGEGERAAAVRAHQGRSYGLALNELANRAELAGAPDKALRMNAEAALTAEDRRVLRDGG